MHRPFQFIRSEQVGDVSCVTLQQPHIEDHQLEDLGAELARLIDEGNCRKMVLNLGPEEIECLFSIFLAKLLNLHRRLENLGGMLALAHADENVRAVFHAAGIEKFFHFYPDQQSAVQAMRSQK